MTTTRSAREPMPDVAAQAEGLGACARVGDEERPRDRGDRDGDEAGSLRPREDERDRGRA